MWIAPLLSLLLSQALPPVHLPLNADWIGTLEFRDGRGMLVIPMTAHITITGQRLEGSWNARNKGSSGTFTGTIDDKGRMKVDATLYGGAVQDTNTGGTEILATERCQGTARFEGELQSSGVFRWTAGRVDFDNTLTRAKGIHCEDLERLTWILQPLPPH